MPDSGREWFSLILDFITAIGATYSAIRLYWQWTEKQRLNQIVSVVLECIDKKQKIVPLMHVRRRNITRAEVQGILRTIRMRDPKSGFYNLAHLNTKKFGDDIELLQDSDYKGDAHNMLIIPCSPEEIEQFDPMLVKVL